MYISMNVKSLLVIVADGAFAFPLEGKLLGCFCEVRFPSFSSWPSARIILGNTVVRSEIWGRVGGGSAGKSALLGKGRQLVHDMQFVQSRIKTCYFACRLFCAL